MPDFRLPDLGEGLEEAEVIAWHVKPGDHVTVDQVVAEVETAKAVVEVPVPYAGVVTALHAEPGGVVFVGQPLITVAADSETFTADVGAGFREPGVVVPEQVPSVPSVPSTADRNAAGAVPGSVEDASAVRVEANREEASGDEASGSVLIGYGTTAAPARSGRRGRRGRRHARGSGRHAQRASSRRGDLAPGPQGSEGRRPRPDQARRDGSGGRDQPPGRPAGHR